MGRRDREGSEESKTSNGELVGLVLGQFNDVLDDAHMLLDQLDVRRVGRQLSEQEKPRR